MAILRKRTNNDVQIAAQALESLQLQLPRANLVQCPHQ